MGQGHYMGKFEKLFQLKIDTPLIYQALVLIFQKSGPTLESVAHRQNKNSLIFYTGGVKSIHRVSEDD